MAEIVWLPPIKTNDQQPIMLMDVMQYFITWHKTEKPIYEILHKAEEVTIDWFEHLLKHYRLSSVFPAQNRKTKTARNKLTALLNRYYKHDHSIDHVVLLAKELTPYTKIHPSGKTRSALKAASILLWYFNKHDICLYDRRSKRQLTRLLRIDEASYTGLDLFLPTNMDASFDHEEGDLEEMELEIEIEMPLDMESYFDFSQCWTNLFLERADDIHQICENLYYLCEHEDIGLYYDCECLLEEWFFRRVFSSWLQQ